MKKDSVVFKGPNGDERYDVRLYHPRTTYMNGRPNWMLLDEERNVYMIDQDEINLDYPLLVKAFLLTEENDAVLVDVIEIKKFTDQKALILPKGKYRLQINNNKRDSLEIEIIVD